VLAQAAVKPLLEALQEAGRFSHPLQVFFVHGQQPSDLLHFV